MSLLTPRTDQCGFTLYETLIVLTIATLVGVGMAGIAEWIERSRAVAQVNALITDLNLSRSEAIKRGLPIVLCTSKTGETCTKGAAWGEGYIIFVDDNGSKAREAEELIIRVHGQETSLRLEYRGFGSHSYIIYQPSGMAANNGTFTVCPRAAGASARTVVISPTGRARSGTNNAVEAAKVCGMQSGS
jgi:type IV fimbrial biogenesis protein FimT